MRRSAAVKLLAALVVLVVAAPAPAAARSFAIDRFAVTLQVNPDTSLSVREEITVEFRGQHQGLYRLIPVRELRGGLEWVLRLDSVRVFDENRQPLRTEVTYPEHYVRIKAWVPGAVNATRTLTILYRVRRGLLAWNDGDELYWNVTGTEWDAPIRVAEAFVAAPRAVPDDLLRAIAYTGPRGGAGADYTVERSNDTLIFRTTRALGPREGLTIAVAWPRGYVARPSRAQEAWWLVTDNWPLGLPLLTLVALLGLWGAYGRDPASNRSVKPEYAPPEGLVPAEAGTLVDERAEPRDLVATLVDLAVRGYLHVEQVTTAFGDTDFLFKRLKPILGDPALKALEIFVLARLFGADWSLNLRLLSEVKRDYDSTFPPIRREIYRTMVQDRLFPASPEAVRRVWATGGLLVMGLGATLFVGAPAGLGRLVWSLGIGVAGSGAVVLLGSRMMPRRTWLGVQTLVEVLGFQEFLERAEKDRLERMPADTIHRWLSWAIALGVTERWLWNFEGLKVAAPTWYTGRQPFSISTYHRDLETFGRRTQEAILTGRRAAGDAWSGGTGFGRGGGSGGFSGGGRGGGGGGTF